MSLTAKSGYKQSEIGEIPEVWDCLTVQQLIDKGAISGHLDGNHGELYPRSHEFKNFGVPYIGANNFYSGQVDLQGCKFLSEERAVLFKKGVAKDGDVLFAHNATVGPVAKLKTSLKYVILSTTATYFRVNGTLLNNDYLMHYMRSELFSNQYSAIMSQSTRNQVPITAQRKLFVVVPPIEEQSKIASSLSVVDALINNLDQLIAKKRNIQQAAMQQLLTGQQRLPGFSGAWDMKRLGEIGEISGAGVDKKIRAGESEVRLLNYTDVYKKDFLLSSDFSHVVTAKSEQITRCSVKKGDVFFTPSSEVRGDIANAAVSYENMPDVTYSYHVVRLRPLAKLDINFLRFAFKSKEFKDQASTACEGSGTRYVITLPKFRAMTIRLPLGVDEQEAIGAVLSDMSADIDALEARRDKARLLKQGMMQELLTGRIRLV